MLNLEGKTKKQMDKEYPDLPRIKNNLVNKHICWIRVNSYKKRHCRICNKLVPYDYE